MITNRHRRVLFALATLTLPLTSPQSLSAQSTVPKKIWFSTGLDVIRDPLTGRLGVPEFLGDTVVSGSANSPVIWQDPATKDALLYIGASNGGVYLRRYSYAEDRWSDRWTWVSRPGSGYNGSQSIGALSISPDGRYLAVGEGNASNYSSYGVPGNGIHIGAIQPDGSLLWLENSSAANAILSAGSPVRSLHWQGQYLAATTWNLWSPDYPEQGGAVLIASQSETGGLETVSRNWQAGWNLVTDGVKAMPNGQILAAGNNPFASASGPYANKNRVGVIMGDGSVNSLEGTLYDTYLQGLDANQLTINRISVHPQMVDGFIVAFVGSYAVLKDGNEKKETISRIDRLVINPLTWDLIDFTIGNVQGKIGKDQAANVRTYGNFSLSANPLDPMGTNVFSGGNQYMTNNAFTTGGGLVQVGFGSNSVSLDYLYGPLRSNGQSGDPPPGQPHADSRQITYYDTPNGLALIQTDDGGVWQLPLQGEGIRWWSSLSAPGLNTLENTTVDWNATTNSVVAAYQDNAASVGNYGSPYPYMQNVWMGDGQLAFFDDAKATRVGQLTSAYVSSYQYLVSPSFIQRTALDKAGLFKSYDLVDMYLTRQGETFPFSEKPWFDAQQLDIPFSAPLSTNAYRPNDVVMAGRFNVYETTAVDPKTLPNSLVFQPLIDDDLDSDSPSDQPTYWVNAIDNRGSPKSARARGAYDSLYVGLQIAGPGGKGVKFSGIYGRQAGVNPLLAPLVQVGQDAGPILAIAHRSTAKKGDTVFWLQGGNNVGNLNNMAVNPSKLQSLAIHSPNGQTRFIPLTDLGLEFSPSDSFKAQSLVYVPAVNGHGEHLVIGSQEGAWISSLNRNGEPGPFTRMNWQGLPEGTPPGSLNVTMTYDPQDDLLVTTQLGQGAWLYSFRGQIQPAKVSAQKLILTDTHLSQQVEPALDKRGTQLNTVLFVQLNDKLMDPTQAYDVDLVFDDFAQWKNNLEMLSLSGGALGITPPSFNLLDTSGQDRFNASLSNGKLTMPIHLKPGVSKMAISVNVKEFPKFVPTFSLNFSATLRGAGDSAAGHLVLSSGSPARTVYIPGGRSQLDPYSPEFNPQTTDALPRFIFGSKQRVSAPNSDDDIVYVGTKGTQVKTGKGADLLYVDGHTAGTNKLYGGPGKNQFRLVGSYQDIPEHAQSVMDFKPGRDTIGLVGVTYEDLRFRNSAQGAELYVFGQKVGIFRHIGKEALKRKKNFVFYP